MLNIKYKILKIKELLAYHTNNRQKEKILWQFIELLENLLFINNY